MYLTNEARSNDPKTPAEVHERTHHFRRNDRQFTLSVLFLARVFLNHNLHERGNSEDHQKTQCLIHKFRIRYQNVLILTLYHSLAGAGASVNHQYNPPQTMRKKQNGFRRPVIIKKTRGIISNQNQTKARSFVSSYEAKAVAVEIESRLQFGSKLSKIIKKKKLTFVS